MLTPQSQSEGRSLANPPTTPPTPFPTFVLSDAHFKPNSLQMIPNISFVVCEFEAQRLFESELEESSTSERLRC